MIVHLVILFIIKLYAQSDTCLRGTWYLNLDTTLFVLLSFFDKFSVYLFHEGVLSISVPRYVADLTGYE